VIVATAALLLAFSCFFPGGPASYLLENRIIHLPEIVIRYSVNTLYADLFLGFLVALSAGIIIVIDGNWFFSVFSTFLLLGVSMITANFSVLAPFHYFFGHAYNFFNSAEIDSHAWSLLLKSVANLVLAFIATFFCILFIFQRKDIEWGKAA